MRFASLGSGSRGNATLVAEGDTCLLLDCGFSVAELERRLAPLRLTLRDLTAILVTHEHSDHLSGVARVARRQQLPVWLTPGTYAAWRESEGHDIHYINVHQPFAIDDLHIHPFPVPHDAREPCQFIFSNGDVRLGILSDTGTPTRFIERQLSGCQALLVEANYEPDLLHSGPYPPALKSRVNGRLGHLSNHQTGQLLRALDLSRLRHLALGHLSEKNNTPALALSAAVAAVGCERDWIGIADQRLGLDWRTV